MPVQPRRFFDLLWERAHRARATAAILLADAGGAALAGALFLSWNGTTIYKFGASEPAGVEAAAEPPAVLDGDPASWARGDRRFDFGRTDLDNEGLRAFKRSWGGVERALVYSTLAAGAGSERGRARRAGIAGAAIRRGPAWLGRGAGEALYRYAGSR